MEPGRHRFCIGQGQAELCLRFSAAGPAQNRALGFRTMSNVDDELAKAVQEAEAVAEAQPAPVAPRPRSQPKRSLGLLIGLLVAGGGPPPPRFSTKEGVGSF